LKQYQISQDFRQPAGLLNESNIFENIVHSTRFLLRKNSIRLGLPPKSKVHESQSTGYVVESKHTGQNGDLIKAIFFP
jgi:hypothetical protein